MDDARWVQCTPSEHAWERAALNYLKTLLPSTEPYRAWANAEFVGQDGSVNEIDLLLVTPRNLVVLEIKSYTGTLTGDAGTWQQTHRAPVDNPVIATNRKARKLKTLLAAQPALRGRRLPWVEPAVFLSESNIELKLTAEGRANVYGRHGQKKLPGLFDLVQQPGQIDAAMSRAIAKAIDQAGIRASQRGRTLGSFRLQMPPLQEGPGWQDFLAQHTLIQDDPKRRVRIYLAGKAEGNRRAQLVRAAEREYRALRGIDHPGIATPTEFLEHDLGPALVFPYDNDLTRLDLFLRQQRKSLSFDDRLVLLRTIAETIAYAHRRVLTHRGLSPHCVWVSSDESASSGFRVQVTDWQTASRGSDTTTGVSVTGTQHVADLADAGATAYLPPEWAWATASGVPLDVFALGAIAYYLFTDTPPASSYAALGRLLAERGHLSLARQVDGVPGLLDVLIEHATQADVGKRTEDVATFLEELDIVREEIVESEAEEVASTDPLEAGKGDELEGGFRVLQRLGRGSTALALRVESGGVEGVLKVSLDPDKDERLHKEAAVLATVPAQQRHEGIVELLDGPMTIGGRLALLLSSAGERTLAQALRERGRLQPEWLHDWGDDLLDILAHLERVGVAHRDVKPDNLGVSERGPKGKKRLVLFDFSLSAEPLDAVQAGTPPYLDPFLGHGIRRVWDVAAERYAVAVTLYEMATARRPQYGITGGHPGFGDADVTIDPELFDRSSARTLQASLSSFGPPSVATHVIASTPPKTCAGLGTRSSPPLSTYNVRGPQPS